MTKSKIDPELDSKGSSDDFIRKVIFFVMNSYSRVAILEITDFAPGIVAVKYLIGENKELDAFIDPEIWEFKDPSSDGTPRNVRSEGLRVREYIEFLPRAVTMKQFQKQIMQTLQAKQTKDRFLPLPLPIRVVQM